MGGAHARGFAITADAFTTCLAAPVLDATDRAVATICFVIPARTPEDRQTELMEKLIAGGRAVSRQLRG